MWRSLAPLHHIPAPPFYPAAAFNSAPGCTESRNIRVLQPSQHCICRREFKPPLTSGLAERKRGIYHLSRNSSCFRLRWAITPQCLTAGDQQPAGRASGRQLWRFAAGSKGSEEQMTAAPSSGGTTSSHTCHVSNIITVVSRRRRS